MNQMQADCNAVEYSYPTVIMEKETKRKKITAE